MVIVANQGPAIIPDSYQLPPFTLVLNGKQYRGRIDRWGYPPDTRPRDVDARLVELADIQLTPVKNPPEPCTEPNSLAYAAKQARVRVQTGATPTTVVLLRFGGQPTPIGDLGPNQTAIMTLPGLVSDRPWAIGAPGPAPSAHRPRSELCDHPRLRRDDPPIANFRANADRPLRGDSRPSTLHSGSWSLSVWSRTFISRPRVQLRR